MLPANGPEACHLRTIDDTLLIYSENSFRHIILVQHQLNRNKDTIKFSLLTIGVL